MRAVIVSLSRNAGLLVAETKFETALKSSKFVPSESRTRMISKAKTWTLSFRLLSMISTASALMLLRIEVPVVRLVVLSTSAFGLALDSVASIRMFGLEVTVVECSAGLVGVSRETGEFKFYQVERADLEVRVLSLLALRVLH